MKSRLVNSYSNYPNLPHRICDLSHVTINSVNHLQLNINKLNGYIKENNGNKYLALVTTDAVHTKKVLRFMGKRHILLDQELVAQITIIKIYENQI